MTNEAGTVDDGADRIRVRDREATRHRILERARELFTAEGYAQVSSRRIAAAAGVNVALINRYFGAKRGLLAEVIAEEAVFPRVLEGDREGLARRLAEHVVHRALGEGTPLQRALEHSASDPELRLVHQERVKNAILEPLAAYIGGPDARARASLVVSLLLGVGMLKRVEGATSLLEHDPAELTARLTDVIAVCLEEAPAR